MASDRELFELRNGRVIMDEELSEKMYIIKSYHPERADETSSGFEWSEMGMANLFGLLYNREARYCIRAGTPTSRGHGARTRAQSSSLRKSKTLCGS